MMHSGSRTVGGDMPNEIERSVNILLDEFMEIVKDITSKRKLRQAVVRSLLTCSLAAIADKNQLILIAQRHFGMPSSLFIYRPEELIMLESISTLARWDLGFEDPFSIIFPIELLNQEKEKRRNALKSIAISHVESEYQRVIKMTSVIQINPLFGPASYSIDERLAFVLMPFTEELTEIYNLFIKPTVEQNGTGLICRRADDYKTNSNYSVSQSKLNFYPETS
ncbi:MAG: hypothetical protein PHY05_03825 [Methanothrix sp.]|nr:hypothetical protein [Methanothrix sp.]